MRAPRARTPCAEVSEPWFLLSPGLPPHSGSAGDLAPLRAALPAWKEMIGALGGRLERQRGAGHVPAPHRDSTGGRHSGSSTATSAPATDTPSARRIGETTRVSSGEVNGPARRLTNAPRPATAPLTAVLSPRLVAPTCCECAQVNGDVKVS